MEDLIAGDCLTSHYSFNHLVDVRLNGKPLSVSATWCSRHDQWISSCSYRWQEKAKSLQKALEECACSQHLHEAADPRTGCHGPCPVCTAMSALGLKLPVEWQTDEDQRLGEAAIEALKLKLGWIEKRSDAAAETCSCDFVPALCQIHHPGASQ